MMVSSPASTTTANTTPTSKNLKKPSMAQRSKSLFPMSSTTVTAMATAASSSSSQHTILISPLSGFENIHGLDSRDDAGALSPPPLVVSSRTTLEFPPVYSLPSYLMLPTLEDDDNDDDRDDFLLSSNYQGLTKVTAIISFL